MTKSNKPTGVHPAADLFPMLPDDELFALAEDIKANGLRHPIVLGADGLLIDGRNRLRACQIAGVEPQFQTLNGYDTSGDALAAKFRTAEGRDANSSQELSTWAADRAARSFVVSANLVRRNLKKGQQAMALAMIYPEAPSKGGRGIKSEAKTTQDSWGVSGERVRQARLVLGHSRALAEDVLADRTPLDQALKVVEAARQQSVSKDAKMAKLRKYAPDVAALVDDERISLDAGLTELSERQKQVNDRIREAKDAVARFGILSPYATVIKTACSLSDDQYVLIGSTRTETDLFGDLSDEYLGELSQKILEVKELRTKEAKKIEAEKKAASTKGSD